jgi:predicted chitinase
MDPNVYRKTFNEKAGDVYSNRQAEIIEDLGNGYFLGDDSYDDDDGFVKAGYSVYKQVGDDSFRMVGSVDMSPYRNPPGHIENEVKKLIASDQNISENADYLEEK